MKSRSAYALELTQKEDQSFGFGLFSSSIEFEIPLRKKMYRDAP
jgi:hypothetical protein